MLQSKTTLRYLLNTQMLQEEEINLKINSLKIDMDCMTVRESLKFKEFWKINSAERERSMMLPHKFINSSLIWKQNNFSWKSL